MDTTDIMPLIGDGQRKTAVQRHRVKDMLSEEVSLDDGIKLKVVQSACSESYRFSGVHDSADLSQRAHYLQIAARLLQRNLGPKAAMLDSALAQILLSTAKSMSALNWSYAKTLPKDDDAEPNEEYAFIFSGDCSKSKCSTEFSCQKATCSVETAITGNGLVTVTAVHDATQ